MVWKLGIGVVMVLGTVTAWAEERQLFSFRTEVPGPGGTLRLEARCSEGPAGMRCRAEGADPSGRGFQFEGRFTVRPPEVPAPERTESPDRSPRWF